MATGTDVSRRCSRRFSPTASRVGLAAIQRPRCVGVHLDDVLLGRDCPSAPSCVQHVVGL